MNENAKSSRDRRFHVRNSNGSLYCTGGSRVRGKLSGCIISSGRSRSFVAITMGLWLPRSDKTRRTVIGNIGCGMTYLGHKGMSNFDSIPWIASETVKDNHVVFRLFCYSHTYSRFHSCPFRLASSFSALCGGEPIVLDLSTRSLERESGP